MKVKPPQAYGRGILPDYDTAQTELIFNRKQDRVLQQAIQLIQAID